MVVPSGPRWLRVRQQFPMPGLDLVAPSLAHNPAIGNDDKQLGHGRPRPWRHSRWSRCRRVPWRPRCRRLTGRWRWADAMRVASMTGYIQSGLLGRLSRSIRQDTCSRWRGSAASAVSARSSSATARKANPVWHAAVI